MIFLYCWGIRPAGWVSAALAVADSLHCLLLAAWPAVVEVQQYELQAMEQAPSEA